MRPIQYSIYKGMTGKWGALQFDLVTPHYYLGKARDFTGQQALENGTLRNGWKVREGTIFMNITSTKDKNVYDWDSKICIALSTTDVGKILQTFHTGQECKIMHDPNAKSNAQGRVKKNLYVSSPKGTAHGCMFRASCTEEGKTTTHQVPVSGDEWIVMEALFTAALPQMLGWN